MSETLGNAHACQTTKKTNISSSSLRRSPAVNRCSPDRAAAADGVAKGRDRSVSCSAATEDKAPPRHEECRRDHSLAIVPVKKSKAPWRSLSKLFMDRAEARLSWPLFHRSSFSDKETARLEARPQLSVVQWAMRLPSRCTAVVAAQGGRETIKSGAEVSSEQKPDEENMPTVPIIAATDDFSSSPSIAGNEEGKVPEELKFLKEKYASVCRLFSYEELVRMTGNFSPGQCHGY